MVQPRCCFCNKPTDSSCVAADKDLFEACFFRTFRNITRHGAASFICHTHAHRSRRNVMSSDFHINAFTAALKATNLSARKKEVYSYIKSRVPHVMLHHPVSSPRGSPPSSSSASSSSSSASSSVQPSLLSSSSSSSSSPPLSPPPSSLSSLKSSSPGRLPSLSSSLLRPRSAGTTQSDSSYSLSSYIISEKKRDGLNPEERDYVSQWSRLCNFHNNFGSDFIQLSQDNVNDFNACTQFALLNSRELASGPAAGPLTTANLAWKNICELCPLMFKSSVADSPFHYIPISMGVHACDLIQHAINVLSFVYLSTRHEKKKNRKAHIIILPHSYLTLGFGISTESLILGSTVDITLMQTDASSMLGDQKSTEEVERQAENELITTFSRLEAKKNERIIMLLIEPFLIPGNGRIYSTSFLQSLQKLCSENNAFLVADETLSFVRCGHPLFSLSIPNFSPDLVMIGKSIGGAILLCNSSFVQQVSDSLGYDLPYEFKTTYSLIAPPFCLLQAAQMLRVMLHQDVSQHCRSEGIKLLQFLKQTVGPTNIRGLGYIFWLTRKGIEQLPISTSFNGRMLPRYDQTFKTIEQIVKTQKTVFKTIFSFSQNAIAAARILSCSSCGDPAAADVIDDCKECETCPRRYHKKCLSNIPNYSCPCTSL
jgi:hypothetical protein